MRPAIDRTPAEAAAVRDLLAAVAGRPAPRPPKRASQPRRAKTECGTRSGYSHGCRCAPCRQAGGRAYKEWQLRHLSGQEGPNDLLPVDPVRAHVKALFAAGWQRRQIIRATGVAAGTLDSLYYQPTRSTRRYISAAVLGLDVDAARPVGSSVNAHPTWRLMGCLAAQGWTLGWQARQVGISNNRHAQMSQKSVDKIVEMARRIGDQRGPSTKTRLQALAAGHLPINCYDAEGDPHPEWLRLSDRERKYLGRAEGSEPHREDGLWLVDQGEPVERIAERLDVKVKTVQEWIRKRGTAA